MSTPEIPAAVKPIVPPAPAEAALIAFERGMGYSNRERVRWALAAALPHLTPGLYVTRHGGYLEVWREDPEHPDRPHALDAREMAEALAPILPDRTEDDHLEQLQHVDAAAAAAEELGGQVAQLDATGPVEAFAKARSLIAHRRPARTYFRDGREVYHDTGRSVDERLGTHVVMWIVEDPEAWARHVEAQADAEAALWPKRQQALAGHRRAQRYEDAAHIRADGPRRDWRGARHSLAEATAEVQELYRAHPNPGYGPSHGSIIFRIELTDEMRRQVRGGMPLTPDQRRTALTQLGMAPLRAVDGMAFEMELTADGLVDKARRDLEQMATDGLVHGLSPERDVLRARHLRKQAAAIRATVTLFTGTQPPEPVGMSNATAAGSSVIGAAIAANTKDD